MSRRKEGERAGVLEWMIEALSLPRTVPELTQLLSVDERTIYRYLKDLEDQGVGVMRVGTGRPIRYRIGA